MFKITEVKDIIIDTDIGDDIDDALAIAFALKSPEVNLKAITTVYGNVEVRTKLALKLLKTFGREDIPVGTGLGKPLMGPRKEYTPNQASVLEPTESLSSPAEENGVDLIISTVMSSPRQVTLIPIGALTNVASAIVAEPRIARARKMRLVIMGGVVGQMKAEYNISCDPEAARIVFDSGLPITMVGLDVTMRCAMKRENVEAVGERGLPTTNLLSKMISAWQGGKPDRYPILHDPLAVAVSFDPSLVITLFRKINVELKGEFTKGFTYPAEDAKSNTTVCYEVDSARFVRLFMERLLS